MAEPSPGAYSDVIDECSIPTTCVGDIAVIAGMAVDNGMFSRYRSIFQNDCVLSAATDAADARRVRWESIECPQDSQLLRTRRCPP